MINEYEFSRIYDHSEQLKQEAIKYSKKRFLFQELNKQRNVQTGIYGLRGTGKTTLLLQIAKERPNSIYVNVEELIFRGISLIEFSEFAAKKGFTNIFFDEIHYLENWAIQLKILYDTGLKSIFFSGSSSILIKENSADLSRRALLFYLPPLSFKEFLDFNYNQLIEKLEIEQVLDYQERRSIITKTIKFATYFEEYMQKGALPIYAENKEDIFGLYQRIIDKIIRSDLISLNKIDNSYVETAYKIINAIATSNPSEISHNNLAKAVQRKTYFVNQIINNLREIGFLNEVLAYKKGISLIRKEGKYLVSPPFRLALAKNLGFSYEQVIGGIREDIFISNTFMFKPKYIKTDRERKTPDFMIKEKVFELGSHKYKNDSDFLVKDDFIIDERVIPLPLFCMLY
ncbi:ATP-binding protein [Candidatus Micrarchaeota archaeon]|nr:ATP-binding protein [Candidatus Micrarchaeota archaeon]